MKRSQCLLLLVFLFSLSQTGCKFFESKSDSPATSQPTSQTTSPTVNPAIQNQNVPIQQTTQDSGSIQDAKQNLKAPQKDDLYSTYSIDETPAEEISSEKDQSSSLSETRTRPNAVSKAEQESVKESLAGAPKQYSLMRSGRRFESKKMLADSTFGQGPSYMPAAPMGATIQLNSESYDSIAEGKTFFAKNDPLSTFSIDVDTASYSNMRRFLEMNQKPPSDSIRIEELINYFSYDYTAPTSEPFAVSLETAESPWNSSKKLVRIGIKGKEIKVDQRPASNLVFLIDVSGSMDDAAKLPLVKSALSMLVDKLDKNDKVSIVVYAGAAGLVLKPTTGNHKTEIIKSLDRLKAGGSTNGAGGIELAYKTASENFIKGGVNRVVLATDGDFNVGTTSREGLLDLIKKHADDNIYLSVLGFGMGNYKDGMMEVLSNKGNGNYAYVDNLSEARKVMVEQMTGTLITIAKDVKIQVEFNPQLVSSYRLIGYENRVLNHEDFNNDKKDAGDIGAGHTVTALYEIIPVGSEEASTSSASIDPLRYQSKQNGLTVVESSESEHLKKNSVNDKKSAKDFDSNQEAANLSNELLTVKLRYKKPDGNISKKIEVVLKNSNQKFSAASNSFRFASAVAMFGMHLRESEHIKNIKLSQIKEIAKSSKDEDSNGYKKEFIDLIEKYETIFKGQTSSTIGYVEE